MKHLLAFAMVALLVPTGAAMAKNPCKEDKVKFCKDVKDAGGNVNECLTKHKDELTDACKERLAEKAESKGKGGDEAAADAPAPAAAPPAAPGGAEDKAQ